jgi:GH25 family lysozyme M1 (1,4-beta-N-acetylmuramidase)
MCGDPIDLSKWQGKEDDPAAMEEATGYAMRILADMVGQLRNEPAPSQLFDLRKSDLPRTGNFRKNRRR